MGTAAPPAEELLVAGAEPSDPSASDQPWPSQKLAWYALVLVTLATMMNFMVLPAALLPLAVAAIASGMKPYAREIERMEAGAARP